jgi:hypothetical protein
MNQTIITTVIAFSLLFLLFGCEYPSKTRPQETKPPVAESVVEPINYRYVKCNSGSTKIYEGRTTDKYPIQSKQGPWIDFIDADTLLHVYVNGDCVIKTQQEQYLK